MRNNTWEDYMDRRVLIVKQENNDMRPMDVGMNDAMEELRREYAQVQGVYEAAIREINARLQTLEKEITRRLRDEILITPRVRLVPKGTLPVSEGKAVRVKDLRKQY